MNPVLRKDILGLLRLKRIAAIQIIFVAVLATMVLIVWPQGGVLTLSGRSDDTLLLGITFGQILILILTIPGVAAMSITGERDANTLEMLYASRISPLQIVFGKLMSAVALPIILLLTGLPFVGLIGFRGAANSNALLWAYLILLITVGLLAAISLAISSLCRDSASALVISYILVLALCGGVLVPAAILLQSASGMIAVLVHDLRGLSPIAALLSVLRPQTPGDFAGAVRGNIPSHKIFLTAAGPIFILCGIIVALRLRHLPAETESLHKTTRLRPRSPMNSYNPMLSKEGRTSSLRSGRWLIRVFYGMLTLSLLLSLMSLYGGTEYADLLRYLFQVLIILQLIGIAAVTPSLTTPAISNEIEAGTFDMLRLTPLRGGKIFWGKFFPAMGAAFLPILGMLPAYATLCFINPAYIRYSIAVLPIILLAMLLCCVLGLACSTFTANSTRATVIAYIFVAAIFALPVVIWWAAAAGLIDNQQLTGWLVLPSPIVMALSVVPTSVNAGASPVNEAASAAFAIVPHEIFTGAMCIALLLLARIRLGFLLRKG
jgi:ABC-type transport system involved in multi-copper enzyme maturation permease subunit